MGRKPVAVKATEKELNRWEKNYASDSSVAKRFIDKFSDVIVATRKNRIELDDQWLDDLRLWSCVNDDMGYSGRSNIFVPELHAQVEISVEKGMEAAFPGHDLVRAVAVDGSDEKKAEKLSRAIQYELEVKNGLFAKHKLFERNRVLFGTGIYKGGFKHKTRSVFTKNAKGDVIRDEIAVFSGAHWRLPEIFRFYIYPEKSCLETCDMAFEDDWLDKETLEERGIYENLDQIGVSSLDPHHQWVDTENLNIVNIASAASVRREQVFITEVWTEFDLNGKEKVPVQAVIANDRTLIMLRRNQFWNQRHPYLADKYIERPNGIFYGFSLPDKIRSQSYQITDLTNHTMDSLSYSLNPLAIIDPALAGDVNGMKFSPGAKWLGSPEGIKFSVFPDVSTAGFRGIQEVRGQIAQFSDNQPGVAPQLQGKARSATQASIIEGDVTQRQRTQGKSLEINVLEPMCRMTHAYLKQFKDKDWQIKQQGADGGAWIIENVSPSDLLVEADFVWMGSSAQEKGALRSQQLLAFFNQALQVASVMPEEVDLPALYKRVASEAFDLKDMDQYFISLRDKKTVDPEAENAALLMGRKPKIHTGDDDDLHLSDHRPLLDKKGLSKEIKINILEHILDHEEQKLAKQEIESSKAQIEALQAEMQQPPQQQSDGREGPQVPSPMEGNQGQVSSTLGDVMTGARGVDMQDV